MATYAELFGLIATESEVKNKVKVALLVAAKTICDEADTIPNHAQRKVWAREILNNVDSQIDKTFQILVASFRAQTIVGIQSATDTTIQQAVDSSVNFLAGV